MPLGKPLLEALDRMGYGGLVLDTAGQVLIIINTGARLLHEDGGKDRRHNDPDWIRCALKSLLRSEGASRFRMDEDAWIVIRRNVGRKRPLILHAVPLAERSASGPHTVVILIDLDAAPQPTPEALQKIFALTHAEAKLAMEIAHGKSPDEIAEAAGVMVGTVRKQLASVFAKTNTHRQAELVALLARVSILP